MVGGLSMVGSSVVDSHTSPCLCLDSLPTSTMNHKNIGGDHLVLYRNSMGRKQFLSSSFVDSWHEWQLSGKMISVNVNRSSKKQRKARKLMIVDELAGQYEDSFEDVKTVILENSSSYSFCFFLKKVKIHYMF